MEEEENEPSRRLETGVWLKPSFTLGRRSFALDLKQRLSDDREPMYVSRSENVSELMNAGRRIDLSSATILTCEACVGVWCTRLTTHRRQAVACGTRCTTSNSIIGSASTR